MKGKKIKEIKVLFREETKQPVSLLEYLIANDLTIDQILQDKTIEGKFMVEMKLGKEVFTWSYGFHDRDEETHVYYVIGFFFKWQTIWEWYSKKFMQWGIDFKVYDALIEKVKGSTRPLEKMERALLEMASYTEEELNFYYGTGPFDDFKEAEQNLEQVLEYDEINTKKRMREEGLYFDEEVQHWIDLPASLESIESGLKNLLFKLY